MGGDATAQELEEESFIMKKELMQMEQSLVEHQEMLLVANTKHEKALTNLQKMDAAWKASVGRIQALQSEVESRDKQLAEVDMLKKILRDQEFAIQTLDGDNKQLRGLVASKDATVMELQGTIERMQVEFDQVHRQLNAKAGMSKDAQRGAEGELQVMVERAARLQGEVNALREEVTSVNARSAEVESTSTQLKSKLLHLTEEHATLQIHLAGSKAENERQAADSAFLKAEISRLQAELNTKDHELLQHQQLNLDVESAIKDTKKKIQLDEQVRQLQTRRMELDVEKKCRDQAHEYDLQLQRQGAILADTKDQLDSALALHRQLVHVLGIDDPSNLHDQVTAELHQKATLQDTVDKLRHKLAVAEKAVSDHHKLQYAYTELEEKHSKTRLAMERIVNRKTKLGGAAPVVVLPTPSPAMPSPVATGTATAMYAAPPPAVTALPCLPTVTTTTPPVLGQPVSGTVGGGGGAPPLKDNTATTPTSHLHLKPAPSFTLKRKAPSFSTGVKPGLAELRSRVAAQPVAKHVAVKSRYMQPPKYL
ncbi:hypothetical protein DYB28_010254 [Aphanomyces astaci]|uniref:Uncharacterized protein n=2 Tax=Aphanomyces astaci TaxID=112090 RepID=A0A397DC25_APHAT|nr:hypothetical protein DYB25_007690 [Aphanomyces astaci]RHY59378.1 hypothetical protein DYB30_005733 [Aphanomyces astaci]RHZ41994.1 hypothetical protein DYB26_006669 [Aphanomyces astaci]RLO11384.1 hypothetical protein DYB28_010254 [Aphanomyces astaci]